MGAVIANNLTPQLDTSEISIAKLLRNYAPTKYNTANVGKWHLHTQTAPKWTFPNYMGYNFYSGNFNGQINNYYKYARIKNGALDTVYNYATTQTINDALGWMDTMNVSKPFFLWVAFNAPHSPYHLPPANLITATGLSGTIQDINANPKKYFKAAIEAMDTEIGRLIQYLTTNNLINNTNIIFIGDNGNASQVAQINNISKAKATLYNYGVHVPMIISGPAVVNPNRTSSALINVTDLFASIAELSGFDNWRNSIPVNKKIDSKSILPIIKNTSNATRSWIFSEQFNSPSILADGKTIRNEDYHLIRFANGSESFYNQTIDSEENNNLLATNMSSVEIQNYHTLCDSLNSLIGSGICNDVSIKELFESNQIQVFPNPAQNLIQIKGSEEVVKYSISDIFGKTILETHSNEMDISELKDGIYFLRLIYNNHRTLNFKFVKN